MLSSESAHTVPALQRYVEDHTQQLTTAAKLPQKYHLKMQQAKLEYILVRSLSGSHQTIKTKTFYTTDFGVCLYCLVGGQHGALSLTNVYTKLILKNFYYYLTIPYFNFGGFSKNTLAIQAQAAPLMGYYKPPRIFNSTVSPLNGARLDQPRQKKGLT